MVFTLQRGWRMIDLDLDLPTVLDVFDHFGIVTTRKVMFSVTFVCCPGGGGVV